MLNIEDIAEKMIVMKDFQRVTVGSFRPHDLGGLKKAEVQTLMQIRHHKGQPMSFYSSKVEMEHGSFTYLIDKLERKGYVHRHAVEGDRRIKMIDLTDEGLKLTDSLHGQFTEHLKSRLNILNEEQLKELDNMLSIMKRLIGPLNGENNEE